MYEPSRVDPSSQLSREAALPPQVDPSLPIVLYIDSAGPGGTAAYAQNLGSVLRSYGYRLSLICSASAGLAPMRDELARQGVTIHMLEEEARGAGARIRRLLWFVSVLRRYRGGILALLLGNHQSGGPIVMAGRLARMRAVVRADLQPATPPFHWWRDRLALKLLDILVDKIVVGSGESERSFVHDTWRGPAKFSVIHTGIDLSLYQPDAARIEARKRFGYTPDTCVIGTIARLEEERKGVAIFIDMAAIVARSAPNARFLIVGGGPLQPELQRRANKLDLHDKIDFAGWRWDYINQLAATDIFVMPSTWEGGPTVVLEAMAMARPVVATRVGMVPEVIVPGKTGLVVDPASPTQLADAVILLARDSELRNRIAASAKIYALQHFSRETMADQYLAVFADALSIRGRR